MVNTPSNPVAIAQIVSKAFFILSNILLPMYFSAYKFRVKISLTDVDLHFTFNVYSLCGLAEGLTVTKVRQKNCTGNMFVFNNGGFVFRR